MHADAISALAVHLRPRLMTEAADLGARLVQAPEQMPWGQTVAYVADINGALVELCTPMGA